MIMTVKSHPHDYEIVIENGALEHVDSYINLSGRILVVTDDGVPTEYAQAVLSKCTQGSLITIPQGEANKNMDTLQSILAAALETGLGRKDCIIAVGGGVVGDMSGFAAACYMRGIDFCNIPTTLLSQVDSSIGGKTAIDFNGVKNIVGAFHNPRKVIIDPLTLNSLPERVLAEGLAESIKMAATSDPKLFSLIEDSTDLKADLPAIIEGSLLIKKAVVEEDPKEQGLRKVLNFGHTLGHAMESSAEGALLHGECVAMGMLPMCSDAVRERIAPVLSKYGLPTEFKGEKSRLIDTLTHDKKKEGQIIKAVYVTDIGSFEFRDMSTDELLGALEDVS